MDTPLRGRLGRRVVGECGRPLELHGNEVQDLDAKFERHEHRFRPYVAVHDIPRVGMAQRFTDVADHGEGFFQLERLPPDVFEDRSQRFPFEKLHRNESAFVPAEFEDSDDVRMRPRRQPSESFFDPPSQAIRLLETFAKNQQRDVLARSGRIE